MEYKGIQRIWGMIKEKTMAMKWQWYTKLYLDDALTGSHAGVVPYGMRLSRSDSMGWRRAPLRRKGNSQGRRVSEKGVTYLRAFTQ